MCAPRLGRNVASGRPSVVDQGDEVERHEPRAALPFARAQRPGRGRAACGARPRSPRAPLGRLRADGDARSGHFASDGRASR